MTPVTRVLSRGRAGLSWLARLLRQPLFANAAYLWGITLVGALGGFAFWGWETSG